MTPLRVMSFNLRSGYSFDGWNSWPLRAPLVRALLSRYAPGLLGLQEAWAPVTYQLSRTLSGHDRFSGHPTGNRVLSVHNPVFYRRRELIRLDAGAFWLSEQPARRSRGWDARHTRAATWMRLAHLGRDLLFVNVHLDHEGSSARSLAVQLILERLRGHGWPKTPAVLCGDFNADAGSALHRGLLAAGFRDCHTEAGQPDDDRAFTFHGFEGRLFPSERRIDWILCSGPLRVRHAEIVRDASPPRYPSDHYPVLADVEWSDEPKVSDA